MSVTTIYRTCDTPNGTIDHATTDGIKTLCGCAIRSKQPDRFREGSAYACKKCLAVIAKARKAAQPGGQP